MPTISQLTAASSLSGTEPLPVVQGGATVQSSPAALNTYMSTALGARLQLLQPNGSFYTFATLPLASSNNGVSAYTTDQGLVFSNGTAWLVTTDTSVKAGLLPGPSNATANATAIMNAAAGGGVTVKLPAGTFYVGPMVFTLGGIQIQGEGLFSTTLIFVPTGNMAAPTYGTPDPGTCFQFCNSAGQIIVYNCSLKRLTIQSTDTTFTKCAVRLCETSQFVLEDVSVSGFYGGDSVGLRCQGHELTHVKRFNTQSCIGIRLSPGLKAYGVTSLANVAVSGTTGQFSCTSSAALSVGYSVTIAGTNTGTGSIAGYNDPTTYRVSALPDGTHFTLTTQNGGALTTVVGTLIGLSYSAGLTFTDHSHFEDLYLLIGTGANNVKNQGTTFYPATLPAACILMDDDMTVTTMVFDGNQAWVGGQYGFYCANTQYAGAINYQWSFKNVRKEQGWGSPTMFYYHNTSADNSFIVRQIYFENCYNADLFVAWDLQGLWFVTMVNCMATNTNSGNVINASTNVLGMEWRSMWIQNTDTVSFGQNPLQAAYYTGNKLPFSASWPAGGFPVANQATSVQSPTTGFSITIGNAITALILTPAGTLATGTITLPVAPVTTGAAVNMEVTISTSQTITALTVNADAGHTIVGAPTTLSANGFCKFLYNALTTTWYRIG